MLSETFAFISLKRSECTEHFGQYTILCQNIRYLLFCNTSQQFSSKHRVICHIVIYKSKCTCTSHFDTRDIYFINWVTVSHFSYAPLLRAHIFSQKCWNRTFAMIIYLLTFYLFDDIEKNIGITHVNHSATPKAILKKSAWLHVQSERLYFLFAFCARHYPWWSLWQKNTKNNYFIQVNPLFSVVEISNTVTVRRNARFDVVLTSVTIIKQIYLRKLSCYESVVGIEVSKH